MRIGIVVVPLLGLVLAGSDVSAQERGRVGLSIAYPPMVGVLWHVTERVAIRPAVFLRHLWSDPTISLGFIEPPTGRGISTTSSSDSTEVVVRVDALFSVGMWDDVRAYIGPGYEYSRVRATSIQSTVTTGPFASPTTTETRKFRGDDHAVNGTFGARYVPHPRFGVFGEAGVNYSYSASISEFSELKQRNWSTITNAGIIFYF